MSDEDWFERAGFLLRTNRAEEAERHIRGQLAVDADDPQAQIMLAACLLTQNRANEALDAARAAVAGAPFLDGAQYVLGKVHEARGDYKAAEEAFRAAIRLDPADPDHFAALGAVMIGREMPRDALAAADDCLRLDPENAEGHRIRALALLKLRRNEEAGDAARSAVAADPDDADSLAAAGFAALAAGQAEPALQMFSDGLRINPHHEPSRAGLVDALKARYWVYRQALRFTFWISSFSSKTQLFLILGAWVLMRVLRSLSRAIPALQPVVLPLMFLYVAFIAASWLGEPMSNLALRLNRRGRLALSDDQRRCSTWVGVLLLGALAALVWLAFNPYTTPLLCLIACVVMLPGVISIYNANSLWMRRGLALVMILLALFGAGMIALTSASPPDTDARVVGIIGFILFALCSAGMSWIGTFVSLFQKP